MQDASATDVPARQKPGLRAQRKTKPMFISITHPTIRPLGTDAVATPGAPRVEELSARALHARLLANAAARRMRAVERAAAQRAEDADYWKSACPMVVAKAAALRSTHSFPALP